MATQVIRYVDPDAVGAGNGTSWADAYTSLQTAQNTEAKDITLLTGSDEQYTFICRSSGGTADSTAVLLSAAWVTKPANYIEIYAVDFPVDGIWDGTKYRIDLGTDGICLAASTHSVKIHHLQLMPRATAAFGGGSGITSAPGAVTGVYVYIYKCIVRLTSVGGWVNDIGIFVNMSTDTYCRVWDCVVYDFTGAATGDGFHDTAIILNVNAGGSGDIGLYNCTIYNNERGYNLQAQVGSAAECINCIGAQNADDFYGPNNFTIDYCASDDGDGTNAKAPAGGSWANEFTNAAGLDFSLKAAGNCVGNGTDNPGAGLFLDDIRGKIRTSTWDIGAFEEGLLVVNPPKFHHYNKNAGGC